MPELEYVFTIQILLQKLLHSILYQMHFLFLKQFLVKRLLFFPLGYIANGPAVWEICNRDWNSPGLLDIHLADLTLISWERPCRLPAVIECREQCLELSLAICSGRNLFRRIDRKSTR